MTKAGEQEEFGVETETPDLAQIEAARLLANEARDVLQARGFSDDQIRHWADTYVAEEGGTADLADFAERRSRHLGVLCPFSGVDGHGSAGPPSFRRKGKRAAVVGEGDGIGKPLIIWGGLVGPAVILGVPLATLNLRAMSENEEPRVDITVSGEQWWWRVFYPEARVETANEIHVPAGEEVRFHLETADVIHSFWVPQAGPKRDMLVSGWAAWRAARVTADHFDPDDAEGSLGLAGVVSMALFTLLMLEGSGVYLIGWG